jgi:hypothetical protein
MCDPRLESGPEAGSVLLDLEVYAAKWKLKFGIGDQGQWVINHLHLLVPFLYLLYCL